VESIPRVNRIADLLRGGAFVTRQRLVLWPAALLIGFVVAIVFLPRRRTASMITRAPAGFGFLEHLCAGVFGARQRRAPFDPRAGGAGKGDLRQRHSVLRLALSAVLSSCRSSAGLPLIPAGPAALAGIDPRVLSGAMALLLRSALRLLSPLTLHGFCSRPPFPPCSSI